MATNPYFQDQYYAVTQDQNLFDDLIVESIQAKGLDHYYLPRTLTNFDQFFGEDQKSAFNSAVEIEMYLESTQGFEGDGSFLSKFGLEIRDSAKLICSISRFTEEITSIYPEITRPREGDIIALSSPIDRRMRFFEITYVNNESTFYQIGKLYTYEITIKNFEYTGETFSTGIDDLDAYETTHTQTMEIQIAAGAIDFVVGERVSQLTGFHGECLSFANSKLVLMKVVGEFDPSQMLLGSISGASRSGSVNTSLGQDSMMQDSDLIDSKVVSGLVDFSESNPFCE